MATITKQTIYLDLTPGRVFPVLHVSQGDTGLEALEFKLVQNGMVFNIPAAVTDIQINGTTPLGVFSYNHASGVNWSGNTVTAAVTQTMTEEAGMVVAELVLLDSAMHSLGSLNFLLSVEPSPYTVAHVSTSDLASISASLNAAQQNFLMSKSWAVGDTGLRDGEATNNSKYWSEESDKNGQRWSTGSVNGTAVPSSDPAYHNNSKYWSEQSAINGERWSVGKINGEDVPPTDETYENNSKYWAGVAEDEKELAAQYGSGLKAQVDTNSARITQEVNDRSAAVSSEASTRSAAVSSLQSQINQYVKPSTQQPDEVVNARVGADGTTYSTLGDAVRGQVTDLKESLKRRINELMHKLTWEVGNIDETTGKNINGTAYIRSNMIEVPLESADLKIANGYALRIYYYTENGVYVTSKSKASTETSVTFTYPKVRFTIYKTDYSVISVSDYSNVILNVPYHDYVDVVKAKLDTVAESTEKAMDTLKNTVSIDFVFSITNGYFANKNSGLESADASSCTTDYIPVIEGQTYVAEKVFLQGNRAICAYDASKNFISAIASSTTDVTIEFAIPAKCCYIKITGRADVLPILNIKTGQQIKTSVLSSAIKYSKNIDFTLVTGKYINQEGNELTSDSFDCTDYIEVVSGYRLGSNKMAPTSAGIKACFYDSQKRPVAYVTGTGLLDDYEFDIPTDAKYIRANKYTGNKASARLRLWYVNDTPYKWEFEKPDVLSIWKSNAEDTLHGFLNVAGHTPIVSFCDDDTTVSAIPALKDLCDTKNIKCTFACVASRLVVGANAEALTNLLLQYQSEGFHIANHSYSHGDFWKSGSESFDAKQCEADLIKAMQTFREKGFIDTDFLVTPFGGANDSEKAMAMKWGFNALINSSDFVANHLWQQGRYKIRRILLTSANTLDYYKALVDTTYDNGDWLLLETHTDIADQWDSTLVGAVIDYIQTKGVSIMPINEAYRIRKPCYDLYAIFKSPI